MTTSGKSNTGEGSAPGGVCQAPQTPERWVQGLTIPAQCFTVRVDVHQDPSARVWSHSIEVYDPHTRERLAMVTNPSRRYSEVLGLVSFVVTDLRAVLLELTDPEPF